MFFVVCVNFDLRLQSYGLSPLTTKKTFNKTQQIEIRIDIQCNTVFLREFNKTQQTVPYSSFMRWSNIFAPPSFVWNTFSNRRFRIVDIYDLLSPVR